MKDEWETQSIEDVLKNLSATAEGLSQSEAERRLKTKGPNSLPEAKRPGIFSIFIRQFKSPLIYILFLAAAAIALIGELTDAYVILGVLIFNSIVGMIQEGRAERTLESLKKLVVTEATVLRDRTEIILPDVEVVPGDVVILRAGAKVPADARLLHTNNMTVNESALTGESLPVTKDEADIAKSTLFKGTYIASGDGSAVVVKTGSDTFIGSIAGDITSITSDLPLKRNIERLSRSIVVVVALVSVFIFAIGIFSGESIRTMFATVVSLSVATIPEGLPIVVTIVLAAGVHRMSKQNVLVRNLQAIESLGRAKVIAVDKTGTITKNELTTTRLWLGEVYELSGGGYAPEGDVFKDGVLTDPKSSLLLSNFGKISALSADAEIMYDEKTGVFKISGDPTEAAILVASEKLHVSREALFQEYREIEKMPFDHGKKYSLGLFEGKKEKLAIASGAPEAILSISTSYATAAGDISIGAKEREMIHGVVEEFAKEGLRTVAIGYKATGTLDEKGFVFAGVIGMKDVLRSEVPNAMKLAKAAGVRVVMITGDHPVTALSIAEEAGIAERGSKVLTGKEIEEMSISEIAEILPEVAVFARVSPHHKLKIIEAFKAKGEIIAMTGDGVNDALSLVAADLGVSMGKSGTDVAKEAADMILLDDNFGNIALAVEEGRAIYRTIKKVILYLFSTSLGGVLVIAGAIIGGFTIPLFPAQIVWLNLVTDGFLTIALAMERKSKNLLLAKPEKGGGELLDGLMIVRMIVMTVPMMIGTLALFIFYLPEGIVKAGTVCLTTLAAFQWWNAWNVRHEKKSLFAKGSGNIYLVGATVLVILLQIFALYTETGNTLLSTTPLGIKDWALIVPVSLLIVLAEETRKFFARK